MLQFSAGQPCTFSLQENKQLVKPLSILLTIALIEGIAAIQARPSWASTPPGTIMQGATMSFKGSDSQTVQKTLSNSAVLNVVEADDIEAGINPRQTVISDSPFNLADETQPAPTQWTVQNYGSQARSK